MACGSCNKKKPKREPIIVPIESNAYVEGVNGYVTVKYIGAIQRRLIGKFTNKVYLFSPDTFRTIDLNDCEAFLSLYDNDFEVFVDGVESDNRESEIESTENSEQLKTSDDNVYEVIEEEFFGDN